MKKPTITSIRAGFVALASAITLASVAGAQITLLSENFDSYSSGNLSGQGGWVMTGTHSPQVHDDIVGTNGSPMIGPAALGASGVIAANNIQESPFGLGSSLNELTLEFDIVQKTGGGIYAFGIGHTSVTPAYVSLFQNRFEIRGENFGTQNPSVDIAGNPLTFALNNQYRVRSVWDLAANDGAGAASLFYQDVTAGDTGFTQVYFSDGVGGVTDEVSLQLATVVAEWDRAWVRVGTVTQQTYFDDVLVTAIPEPAHFAAVLGLGMMAFLWIRRQKRAA